MDFPALQAHLVTEATRFRAAITAAAPDAKVPTCPEWTAIDLLDHLTETYDHKIQSMRLMRRPGVNDGIVRPGGPAERFDAALAELLAEFDDRGPESLSYTWYGYDQTTGFWIRRMTHETLVHRADAELAAGLPVGPIDAALALDGIDEMLMVMLSWGSRTDRDWAHDTVAENDGLQIEVKAGSQSWTVICSVAGIAIADGVAAGTTATVSGTPGEVLLWLWGRLPFDALAVEGDRAAVAALYELAEEFTQ
jgi:uncharacterized protein (TIGR03083 family)